MSSNYGDDYYACTQCPAQTGTDCYALLSAGPEALPCRFADKPHGARQRVGSRPKRAPAGPRQPAKARTAPARRAASKTQSTADAWRRLAAKQAEKRQ